MKFKTGVVSSPGKKPIHFKAGALRAELGAPAGKPIPAAKTAAAASGAKGPLAARRANFAKNVLTGRKHHKHS